METRRGLNMKLLKERILRTGKVKGENILKVDNFLNHQLDVALFNEMGKEFKKRFATKEVTKILTIEASGIAIACIAAQYFDNVPVLFAKKIAANNLSNEVYESSVYSFTKDKHYKIRVDKNYLQPADKVLIIDDFLANGNAVQGLIELVNLAGAEVVGVGIAIEKGFQKGREVIVNKGIQLESLAIIESLAEGKVTFAE